MKMMNNLKPQECNKCGHKLWIYARDTKDDRQGYMVIVCPRCGLGSLNKDASNSS